MNDLKGARKHFSKLAFMFLLGMAVIYGVNFLVGVACDRWPALIENDNMRFAMSMLPMYLVGMPALIRLVCFVPAEKLPQVKIKFAHYLVAVIICIMLMYSSNLVGVLITTVIGAIKGGSVQNELLNLISDSNIFLIFFFTVICAPLYEEFIFRKLIVDRAVKYGKGIAVVLSGVMFGLFHGNFNQFVYATVLGMFFAFIYVKTGKLRYTVGLHMIMNFLGGVLGMIMLRMLKYEDLVALLDSGASDAALMELIMDTLPGWIVYLSYLMLIFVICIAGLVILIVYRKQFALPVREQDIPKGKRFVTAFCNIGMICYCLYWIITMIGQLLQ